MQNRETLKPDFSRGTPHFILAGLLFTIVFVVGMIVIVNLVFLI